MTGQVNKIIFGDALEVLKSMPDNYVDCCITSPPYFGLRDYQTATWEGGNPECDHIESYNLKRDCSGGVGNNGRDKGTRGEQPNSTSSKIAYKDVCLKCGAKRIDKQLGLEKTPEEYVAKLVEIFHEVKRVLKKEGTLWLVIGDSYAGSNCGSNDYRDNGSSLSKNDKKYHGQKSGLTRGLKPKDLVGIPWMVSFALRADGWYLRQDIIWAKPNPMPESVTDRCTKSHEYVFLLSKSGTYYYDSIAIKEPSVYPDDDRKSRSAIMDKRMPTELIAGVRPGSQTYPTRNKHSVWTINTAPYTKAHYAVFPPKLIEPMILAGTSEKGICSDCGKAWMRITKENPEYCQIADKNKHWAGTGSELVARQNKGHPSTLPWKNETIGWQPQCKCNKEPVPAIILDPFFGSGTVGVIAIKLGRNWIGIELNPDTEIMRDELKQPSLLALAL